MMRATIPWLLAVLVIVPPAARIHAQDARTFVEKAVQNELAKDADDHTRWLYYEDDRKPENPVKQWVADTSNGSLKRVLQIGGHKLSQSEQLDRINRFLGDTGAQSSARKSSRHDDEQAAEMLQLLPKAFLWTRTSEDGGTTLLHFKPDPNFRPPDIEARVFAAMEGDMAVDTRQLRIASLKGKMIQDVKILGGLLGELNAGGTFDVERRETGDGIWQITETHVHIDGHALLFKTISEHEDDIKTHFKQLPQTITMQQARNELMQAPEGAIATAHSPGAGR
jgi:hypothetical protein